MFDSQTTTGNHHKQIAGRDVPTKGLQISISLKKDDD